MSENILEEIRAIPSFDRAIIKSVELIKSEKRVEINIVTDKAFAEEDGRKVKVIARSFVPGFFSCDVYLTKLTPDEGMVAKKIYALIPEINRPLSSFITPDDISVERTENGFYFTVKIIHTSVYSDGFASAIAKSLKENFCGEFSGECVASEKKIDDIDTEETHENIQFELPVRRFPIVDFEFIEGNDKQTSAVYMCDLNFESESVVLCGKIVEMREHFFKKNEKDKLMYNFTVTDGTARLKVGYFTRQRSVEKIKKLQVGDEIVLTCRSENFNGGLRATAVFIDRGRQPENFVPEKRPSKPVPKYYETVFPQPFEDFTQRDLFYKENLPDCLKDNVFVVFDLETTGLNTSPASGNMDKIIEIGAYKIIGGEIKESFTTFVNPECALPRDIISLTGIDQQTVDAAPVCDKVMPDFYKFCDGAYLVGHNAANFDFRFIDYYGSRCGYIFERRIFDTIPLSQQILPGLSNYKLNTVADRFGITFNHHRATDDALVTAKIFIELLKIKKVLPNPC